MNESTNTPGGIDLRPTAAYTGVVIGMVASAAVAYLLLDILLLLFIGIVVAAALQPWHAVLCRWGVPKGVAVLLIYLFLLVGLGAIAIVVGPVLVEQVGTFVAGVPGTYASARSYLQASGTGLLHFLGQRIPPFERLQDLTAMAPQLFQGTLGLTASIVKLPAYFVTVLAIGFYWTLEVPRFERLVLSLLAVERRPRALNVWHEIESKLGGFIRGQLLAMLFIGTASALGYALIGLPNVLALAVLAGLLEAVPLIGPALAVAPAILFALPSGLHTVILVVGFAMLLQGFENNVLIPRIMRRAVGVSALVGLLAILAFGTLYGIAGVLIAIPMTAVIQVLLDTLVVNAEPATEPAGLAASPWDDLRARLGTLRQQARARLRTRTTRMGIDVTADHLVDAIDQEIEVAVARVEQLISAAQETAEPLAVAAQSVIADKLQGAMERIEQAVERGDATPAATEGGLETIDAAEGAESGGTTTPAGPAVQGTLQGTAPEAVDDNLDQASRRFKDAVQDVETLVVAAQEQSRGTHAPEDGQPPRRALAPALGKRE